MAFEALVDKFRRPLVSFLFRMVHDQAIAEELAQETFLCVYRSRSTYSANATFTSWLYRIAANVAINHARDPQQERANRTASLDEHNQRTGLTLDVADPSLNSGQAMVRRGRLLAIRRHIDALPVHQRLAVLMHKYQGLDYREIAEVLTRSESEIKSLLFRAYERLREELKEFIQAPAALRLERNPARLIKGLDPEGQMNTCLDQRGINLVEAKAAYTRWASMVLHFCELFLGEKSFAERVTVESFVRLLRGGGRLPMEGVPVALLSCAFRLACETSVGNLGDLEPLRAAIVHLDPMPRAVFILHGVMSVQMPWVAGILGMPPERAAQLWARALVEIREQLPQDFSRSDGDDRENSAPGG